MQYSKPAPAGPSINLIRQRRRSTPLVNGRRTEMWTVGPPDTASHQQDSCPVLSHALGRRTLSIFTSTSTAQHCLIACGAS